MRCKLSVQGFTGRSGGSSSINNICNRSALPSLRSRAFVVAFREANASLFDELEESIKRKLRELPVEELKQNGQFFLKSAWRDWLFTSAQLQVIALDECV
jgi:hypothetical protein